MDSLFKTLRFSKIWIYFSAFSLGLLSFATTLYLLSDSETATDYKNNAEEPFNPISEITLASTSSDPSAQEVTSHNIAAGNVIEPDKFIDEQPTVETLEPKINEYYEPLKTIHPTQEQYHTVYEAEERLVESCMNEKGFTYIPNSSEDISYLDEEPEAMTPGDTSAAKIHGYGLANAIEDGEGGIRPPESDTQDPNGTILSQLSPSQRDAWDEALMGNVGGGGESSTDSMVSLEDPISGGIVSWDANSCFAIARAQLFGSIEQLEESEFTKYNLQNQVFTMAEEDVKYKAAIGRWKNCMAAHGYNYDHPDKVSDELVEQYHSGKIPINELRASEIAIATVDSRCHQQSSVTEAYNSAIQQAEATVVGNEYETIDDIRQTFENAVKNALVVIEE